MRLLAGLALVALAIPPGPAQALRDVNGDGRVVVLAFGDSITLGGLHGSYVGDLRGMLPGTARVVNEGRYGEKTAEGRARLPEVLAAEAPDYVLLQEGINDVGLLEGEAEDVCDAPVAAALANLRAMIAEVERRRAVLLVGTVFISPRKRGGTPARCAEAMNAGIRALPVARIDFEAVVRGRTDALLFDGVHLNVEGSRALAREALRALDTAGRPPS